MASPAIPAFTEIALKYLGTKDGCQGFLNVVNLGAQWLNRIVTLSPNGVSTAQNVAKGFGSAADSLYLFDFIGNLNSFASEFANCMSRFKERKIFPVKKFAYAAFSVASNEKRNDSLKKLAYASLGVASSGVDSLKFVVATVGKSLTGRFTVFGSGAGAMKSAWDIKNELTGYLKDEAIMVADQACLVVLRVVRTVAFLAVDSLAVVGVLFTTFKVGTFILTFLSIGVVMNGVVYYSEQAFLAKG